MLRCWIGTISGDCTLYLLGQNSLLLKKLSQVQDNLLFLFVHRKKNIVCISLVRVLRTFIKDGDKSNAS